jgi:hypothetical protein
MHHVVRRVCSVVERVLDAGTAAGALGPADAHLEAFNRLPTPLGSLHAAAGAHPKVAQAVMRHSDINLTLSCYSHVYAGQEADAVAALPDPTAPARKSAKATGTDRVRADAGQAAMDASGCPTTGDHAKTRPREMRPRRSDDGRKASGKTRPFTWRGKAHFLTHRCATPHRKPQTATARKTL